MPSEKDGVMIILSSPSGAGKTTLVKKLSEKDNFEISISHTTRQPRPNEHPNEDYFFINETEFQRLSKNVEINNFNIRCLRLGCSDCKNKLKLWYTDKNKRGGSSILQDSDKELNKYDKSKLLFEEIETDKLDNLYSLENKKIFFKIDVERHELKVLEGALNILSNNQCYLQIEIFPHLQDEILSFLNDNHFKLLHRINNDFYLKNFF